MNRKRLENLRNVAIIAHVDHGKTTLVDALLAQTNVFRQNQKVDECVLDSNDLERERGITIFSKNASIVFKGTKINIIDTPGHADFGGEVERVLNMADGVLLLVDAFEGPMPQTRFVLSKALQAKLKVLVVVNKIDRPDARPESVVDDVFDLFGSLDATDEQLDFPLIYASGRDGYTMKNLEDRTDNCLPLLDSILQYIPAPLVASEEPLQIQISTLDYNDYVGRIAIGRVNRGVIHEKETLSLLRKDGTVSQARVEKLEIFEGVGKKQVSEVAAGDIVIITGIPDVDIYDTLTHPDHPEPIPAVIIDEPTLTMEFRANDSPFSGREGEYVTSRHLKNRLDRELLSNVALRVKDQSDSFLVSGRGLMHLGILVENMRREGYEFAVGRPHVIFREIEGKRHEPIELLTIDVAEEMSGKVMELIGPRRGEVLNMESRGGRLRMEVEMPSRGILGLRSRLLTATKGEVDLHHCFLRHELFKGEVPCRPTGVLVSSDMGPATPYAIDSLQLRGDFFIAPGTPVYVGMIVGENSRNNDLDVNVCRVKKMTNVRSAGSDKNMEIAPPRDMSLEMCLEYLEEDELLEVTPKSLRMRKRVLNRAVRERMVRQSKV